MDSGRSLVIQIGIGFAQGSLFGVTDVENNDGASRLINLENDAVGLVDQLAQIAATVFLFAGAAETGGEGLQAVDARIEPPDHARAFAGESARMYSKADTISASAGAVMRTV